MRFHDLDRCFITCLVDQFGCSCFIILRYYQTSIKKGAQKGGLTYLLTEENVGREWTLWCKYESRNLIWILILLVQFE